MISPLLLALSMGLQTPPQAPLPPSIYSFTMKDIDGKSVTLDKFKGKVLLVVNVASKCGNTPQYAGLEKLYRAHKQAGLEVLGFPANDFREQEPGTDEEIKAFCASTYGVTFPMFSKVAVNGESRHLLYKWLVATAPSHEDIEWNFAKFLISREGKVIARFAPKTKPESEEIASAIANALKANEGEAEPPTEKPMAEVGLCGAPTKAGGTCKRKVKGGGRCYQHKAG
jgi:glutathione peroxidase